MFHLRNINLKAVAVFALVQLLQGCGIFSKVNPPISIMLPGERVHSYLSERNPSTHSQSIQILHQNQFDSSLKDILDEHSEIVAELYWSGILEGVAKNDFSALLTTNLVGERRLILEVLIKLYPAMAREIVWFYMEKSLVSTEQLLVTALAENIDISDIFPPTAQGTEISVSPLINSAGIVIYGQTEDSENKVRFKEAGDNNWIHALELAWDPIHDSLAGSVVYLEENTSYDLEIEVTTANGGENTYALSFTTKSNSPPIDPDKIYYLSDIYSDGQLDLEALNIFGSETGYAKIIGDGPIIRAAQDDLYAVNIGRQSYVVLENLTIRGGGRYGIYSDRTHHIWIKGCDIAEYGRVPGYIENGIGYETSVSENPINYDSGIYLEKTGSSVIEECEIHSPNYGANNWGRGHPKGPSALLVWAYHPEEKYRGQMIVRNNKFYGSDTRRFNDVIEGRKNSDRNGGFVRDSAIYGNFLAYSNDDIIEIDGGQRNVLVYDNEITKGYAGVSIAPNTIGPSYVFHNYIHDMGDERDKEWTAIKAGGLMAVPGGKTFIFENYINTNRNGISASRVKGDSTFWVDVRNNVIINHKKNKLVGLGIYDKEKYPLSSYKNNVIINTKINDAYIDADFGALVEYSNSLEWYNSSNLVDENVTLPIEQYFHIDNFSRAVKVSKSHGDAHIKVDAEKLSHFDNQTKYGEALVNSDGVLEITGNGWYKLPIKYEPSKEEVITFDFEIIGNPEIVGIALETDNRLSSKRVLKVFGTQDYGIDVSMLSENSKSGNIKISPRAYGINDFQYIVFILDNDVKPHLNDSKVSFRNVKLLAKNILKQDESTQSILVGKLN